MGPSTRCWKGLSRNLDGLVRAVGTAAFGYWVWRLVGSYHVALPHLVDPSDLSGYAISSALRTGIGRAGLELTQALSSRYIIFFVFVVDCQYNPALVSDRCSFRSYRDERTWSPDT